jgi:hypothetical protein
MLVHTSKLYNGMKSNYWIYVPAQYDPAVPAALMVWQDGERYNTRNVEEACRLCPSLYRLQEVTDNLIAQKKIPVMIHVFVSPGTAPDGRSLRSVLYDTVSEKYGQFIREVPGSTRSRQHPAGRLSRAIQGNPPVASRRSLRLLSPGGLQPRLAWWQLHGAAVAPGRAGWWKHLALHAARTAAEHSRG